MKRFDDFLMMNYDYAAVVAVFIHKKNTDAVCCVP